jgi:hypothetical protein
VRARSASAITAASILTVALVLAGTPGGVERSAASQRCGKITIKYSYGDYRFAVRILRGDIECRRARRVMKRGIPATRPDPGGWRCLSAPAHVAYTDVCRSDRGDKKVVARLLGSARPRA